MTSTRDTVIVGAGPAGRAAAAILPDARVIARPDATAWHAEPGRVWIETASGVHAVPFTHLLLCANEPLLLLALGCAFTGDRPTVDARGATSVHGVFAAGSVLGAATPGQAARQARIAAAALAGMHVQGRIQAMPASTDRAAAERLDPLDIARLLEQPAGSDRNRPALAQSRALGGTRNGLVAPARPVGFAALAAMAPARLDPREPQQDAARLTQRSAA